VAKKSSAVSALAETIKPEPLLLKHPRSRSCAVFNCLDSSRLLWNNEIPHIKIGRRFLVDPADLREFIQRKKEDAGAA
jgi:hypothetical protein